MRETGICCPDIGLLPALADLFDVDLDTLMGRERAIQPPQSFREIAWQLRRYFESTEPDSHFRDTFRLAVILHEVLSTDGYRKPVPWEAEASFEKTVADAEPRKWGTSITSLPNGSTVYSGSGLFFGYANTWQDPSPAELHRLSSALRRLANPEVLLVLYALYSMTRQDFDRYVTLEEIAGRTEMPLDRTRDILDALPLTISRYSDGAFCYRLEGAYMYLPTLLSLCCCQDVPDIAFR